MKLLVPTDFSRLSFIAAKYAAGLAEQLKAEIILLHIVPFDLSARMEGGYSYARRKHLEERDVHEEIAAIRKKLQSAHPSVSVSGSLLRASPLEGGVARFARKNNAKLIVQGTGGAGGLKKKLIGSNAAAVISASTIPVLTVPEKARFSGIKKILYSSDLKDTEKELQTLASWAKLFKSTVEILHVVLPGKDVPYEDKIRARLTKIPGIKKFSITAGSDVSEEIEEYYRKAKADVLAMFIRRHNFFERLFGKSATREISFRAKLPMLSFRKQVKLL